MHVPHRSILFAALLTAATLLPVSPAVAQTHNPAAANEQLSDKDVAATQEQLLHILRTSPTLTTVVARDPSLLSDPAYVQRNNPQLADFIAAHPDVARNPGFYLFSHLDHPDGQRDEALERAVWPDLVQVQPRPSMWADFLSNMPPVLALACFLVAVAWMVRVFLENRRWNRIFKLQSEVHGRLIDKFSSTQELSSYMETEAGRRFLEAAPIPVQFEGGQRVPNAVARVLTPLQVGVVMTLLGIGLLLLRSAIGPGDPEMQISMLVLGTIVLMPGIGFILSAGITWVLAGRLGLMPESTAATRSIAPFGPQDKL
ncbi:MAG TPA: hypothetical protein VGR64_09560 [Terracidiphilus sp.]|nr:hypothetical protein [Terracidiphilus sp.]